MSAGNIIFLLVIGVIWFLVKENKLAVVRFFSFIKNSQILNFFKTKPVVAVVPRPVAPSVPVQRVSNSLLWAIFFILLVFMVGVVWFYVLPNHPDLKHGEVFENLFLHKDLLKGYWWYGVAPLAGLFSYYFGDARMYKRPFTAILVTVVIAGCMYLYLHPEVLKTISGTNTPIISTELGLIIIFLIAFFLLMSGNVLTLLLFLIILFFYYSYTLFGA